MPSTIFNTVQNGDLTELQRRTGELAFSNALLDTISRIQSRFITSENPRTLFDDLLRDLLHLTGSPTGFIGEIVHDEPDHPPFLRTFSLAQTDMADAAHPSVRMNGTQIVVSGLEQFPGLPLSIDHPVVVDIEKTSLKRQLSPLCPSPESYLSLPCRAGDVAIGLVGLSNRPGGYNETIADILRPICSTCATLIEGLKNIRSRHAAEHESQSNLIRWQSLIDNVLDGIITISDTGIIESFNPAATLIFGYSPEDVIGRNVKILMPEPYHSKHDTFIRNYTSGGPSRIIGIGREVEGRRSDGSTFPLDLAVSEMWLEDRRYFIGIVRDITKQKEIDRMKQELIASISHELRTPLTSIRGALGLLTGGAAGPLPEKAANLIGIAHSNSLHLGRLIDDILDLEKLKSGKMQFSFSDLDLHDLVKHAIDLNQSYATQFDVTLVEKDPPETAITVHGDSKRLLQVLTNILSNAAKFSPAGGTVTLSIERHGTQVRVSVADQGSGIPESFRAHVFEKFTQADSTDRRKVSGTGLGLNIARHIMNAHGGIIDFITPPEGGTIFFFELPEIHQETSHDSEPDSHS